MGIARKLHNLTHPVVGHILMLHSITEHPVNPGLEITPKWLEQTINNYQARGWLFVSIDNLATLNTQHTTLNTKKWVCLTFDDGYLDNLTLAHPILKKHQVPFCLYATRDFYRGTAHPHWNPEASMMTAEQLAELSHDPLCTIGCHTCSHPHLSTLPVEQQRRELADSKADLEQLLGTDVRHLAYPHGDYNADTLRIVAELGFKTAVTTSGRPVRTDAQLLELDRITLTQPN